MKWKQIAPHAAAIIWNYADRVDADGATDANEIEQIIVSSSSLISISTSKRKSQPTGTFEFHLAPTENWVARITPGSWCVLLMSQNKPIPKLSSTDVGTADPELLKMLGRIDTVRVAVEVNQETGARSTTYIVTGQDWCSVFDSKMYIDPILRNDNLDSLGAIGESLRILYGNFITDHLDSGSLPTTSQLMTAIITLWGAPLSDIESAANDIVNTEANPTSNPMAPTADLVFSSGAQYQLPIEVAKYMKFGSAFTGTSVNFSELILLIDGILTSYDRYGGDNADALGILDPASMYGTHSFWQLLTDNCNPALNELVTDLRWDGTQPTLALYKRVKPFINRNNFDGSDQPQVTKNVSKFANVRTIKIPIEDAININAGTNWRDKVNFIEISPQWQNEQLKIDSQIKVDSQAVDRKAYEREGFKPMIQPLYQIPFGLDGKPLLLEVTQWKYLLKEWFFNTHLMLNGSMNIIGQNTYIQVGDNIMVDAGVFGPTSFNSKQIAGKTYFTAHVEAIMHQFAVSPETGARSFFSTVQFVRGIFTDENGAILGQNQGSLAFNGFGALDISALSGTGGGLDSALDSNAKNLPGTSTASNNVMSVSTSTDPKKSK